MPGEVEGLGPGVWLVLAGVWMGAAAASGLVLAVLARRIHPRLSLFRLWVFYSLLTALLVAVVLLVGIL